MQVISRLQHGHCVLAGRISRVTRGRLSGNGRRPPPPRRRCLTVPSPEGSAAPGSAGAGAAVSSRLSCHLLRGPPEGLVAQDRQEGLQTFVLAGQHRAPTLQRGDPPERIILQVRRLAVVPGFIHVKKVSAPVLVVKRSKSSNVKVTETSVQTINRGFATDLAFAARQSKPSMSSDIWARLIITMPSAGLGQMNFPSVRRFCISRKPLPSYIKTLIVCAARPRKMKRWPLKGSSHSTVWICAARPSMPRRRSVRPAAR